nr:hypothetical protein [uncultured Caldimonas sp.]
MEKFMIMLRGGRWLAAGVLSALLVACGGGGGGDDDDGSGNAAPSSATGDFSQSNYATVADAAAVTALGSGELNSYSEIALNVSDAGSGVDLGSVMGVRRFALEQLRTRNVLEQALATESMTEACDVSGSFHVSVTYKDANTVSPGDRISFTLTNCAFEPGEAPVNGSFTLTFVSYTDESNNSVSIAFENFGAAGETVSGAVTVTTSQNGSMVSVAAQGLTATFDGESVTWYHTTTVTPTTLSLNGFIVINGAAYQLTQASPFTLSVSGDPASGALVIRDADGDRVEIVAGATAFTYNFYAASNSTGTPTATVQGMAYAD